MVTLFTNCRRSPRMRAYRSPACSSTSAKTGAGSYACSLRVSGVPTPSKAIWTQVSPGFVPERSSVSVAAAGPDCMHSQRQGFGPSPLEDAFFTCTGPSALATRVTCGVPATRRCRSARSTVQPRWLARKKGNGLETTSSKPHFPRMVPRSTFLSPRAARMASASMTKPPAAGSTVAANPLGPSAISRNHWMLP